MRLSTVAVALAATLLIAGVAAAEDEAPAAAATTSAPSAKEPQARIGEKTYKQRINTVARKPLNHDIKALDSNDRATWNGHDTWQGVRDERPLIARKTMGFHDPRPHRTRMERVMMLSRGPIRGAGFDE